MNEALSQGGRRDEESFRDGRKGNSKRVRKNERELRKVFGEVEILGERLGGGRWRRD